MKSGYKLTEVGVIPDDWETSKVGEVCNFIVPGRNKPKLFDGDIPWITTPDLQEGRAVSISRLGLCLSPAEAKSVGSKIVPPGSVLMSCTGELGIVAITETEMVINQQLHAFIPTEKIEGQFLLNALSFQKEQIAGYGTKTAVPYLNKTACNSIYVPLPSIPEQTAIATALSDVDALLDGLDRLIAKKRDLKQAAMQQLLTGETRLPGFEGEWEVRRLGDHVTFLRNGVNSRAELTLDDPVKYLHYGDIHSCTSVMLEPASLPSLPSGKAKTLERLRDGDLIFADASEDLVGVSKSVEISNLCDAELVAGLHTIAARFDKAVLADGFKAYLQFCPAFSSHLRRLAAGTKVYATNRSHIASVEMRLPGIKEQEAIAATFNDMDAEIAALEQRRNKTKDIKQAMMQELLTGRTRLV